MPLLPRRYHYSYLLPALFAVGCAEAGNLGPVNARPLDPPAIYQLWWRQVEACTEFNARFDRVDWFEADELVNTERETRHMGAWKPPHSIYVRTGNVLSESVVKHEMVHELLQRKDHDMPLFRLCAGH